MKGVQAFIRSNKIDSVLHALHEHPDFPGVTVSEVRGFERVSGENLAENPKFGTVEVCKLECIVDDAMIDNVVEVIRDHALTGRPGDGKIAVVSLDSVVEIHTGETGESAME